MVRQNVYLYVVCRRFFNVLIIMGENILEHPSQLTGNILKTLTLEADIFSGIPRVTGNLAGIPRDGKQNRYESRDWDGTGKNLIGSGRDRE